MAIAKNIGELRRPTKKMRVYFAKKTRVYFARVVRFLVEMLSSPKGDQGGWEGGARGL
jgi:hypothetical protein